MCPVGERHAVNALECESARARTRIRRHVGSGGGDGVRRRAYITRRGRGIADHSRNINYKASPQRYSAYQRTKRLTKACLLTPDALHLP